MPDTSTVFQAEIEALRHTCQYALANLKELNIKYIKLLSDSQAAIKALNIPRITTQAVLTAIGEVFVSSIYNVPCMHVRML